MGRHQGFHFTMQYVGWAFWHAMTHEFPLLITTNFILSDCKTIFAFLWITELIISFRNIVSGKCFTSWNPLTTGNQGHWNYIPQFWFKSSQIYFYIPFNQRKVWKGFTCSQLTNLNSISWFEPQEGKEPPPTQKTPKQKKKKYHQGKNKKPREGAADGGIPLPGWPGSNGCTEGNIKCKMVLYNVS